MSNLISKGTFTLATAHDNLMLIFAIHNECRTIPFPGSFALDGGKSKNLDVRLRVGSVELYPIETFW